MSSLVEGYAKPIREWTLDQARRSSSRVDSFHFIYAPRLSNLGFTLSEDPELRNAWAQTAQWLVAYVMGAVDREGSPREAQRWFVGDDASKFPQAEDEPFAPDAQLPPPSETWALLPYLLDPLGPGTRRSVAKDECQQDARLRRKTRGVFYTPSDLAEFMIRQVESEITDTWLDPACGTGVFLRIPLLQSASLSTVFGCDVSELALEMCAFVLLASLDTSALGRRPWAVWQMIRNNLACIDSLLLLPGSSISISERRDQKVAINDVLMKGGVPDPADDNTAATHLGDIFPELVEGARSVVMNPPYAALGTDVHHLRPRFETLAATGSPSTNTFVPFIEQGLRLMDQNSGRFCAVVPLSIATSSQGEIRKLRSIIEQDFKGTRYFRFFDRAPDALFGDDVKTRNAVMTVHSNGPDLTATTSLYKWTSGQRHRVFLRATQATPVGTSIERLIPKIGSEAESELYSRLRVDGMDALRSGVMAHRTTRVIDYDFSAHQERPEILIAPTAYNWLNCLRATSPALDMGFDSTVGYHHLTFQSSEDAWAAYAVVSSRLVLWLWRTEADAFHVTRDFLLNIPVSPESLGRRIRAELIDLGRALWKEAVASPSISVNKARTSVGFRVDPEAFILDDIDGVLADALGLNMSFDLRKWHSQLVDVERNRENR